MKIEQSSNSFFQIVKGQFFSSRLNKVSYYFILFCFLLALLAPFLANNKPYVMEWEGKTYFPILTEVFPFKHFINYPELQGLDFQKIKHDEIAQSFIYPPVPYSPTEYNLDEPLVSPNSTHYLGTDEQGRDIASRMIHGSRISLSVGFVAVSLYVFLGIFIGALAGYYGGRVDFIISRFIEIIMCFPTFFLILTVLAFVGPNLYNIMIVIGLTGWTGIARLVRGEFLKLRNQDFVSSVQALGASSFRVIFKHILPNALAPVMVMASFGMASAILVESSLSYLGFGVQPPTPSWGDTLSQSRDFMDIAWWLTLFPGIAIFMTITAFNLFGEGLRNAIDPKLKKS